MGQAAVDLPDPLQSSNPADARADARADAQSADDLLSQLAGNEIDRLLAENDETPAATSPAAEANPTPAPDDLDAVLADAAADRKATAERSALHEPAPTLMSASTVDTSPQIELGDSPKLSLLFRPLEWLSAPLDPWPDQLREAMGKVGLMTLINALAVLVYVMYRKHHP